MNEYSFPQVQKYERGAFALRTHVEYADGIEAVRSWMGRILKGDPLSTMFETGWMRARLSPDSRADERAPMPAEISREIASAIVSSEISPARWPSIASHLPEGFRGVQEPADLSNVVDSTPTTDSLVEDLVELAELWLEPLKRKQRFIEDVTFDLEDLRRGIDDKLSVAPADILPCLLIDADGMIGTVLIPRPAEVPAMDHTREVAILNRSSGRDLLTIVDWNGWDPGESRNRGVPGARPTPWPRRRFRGNFLPW